MFARSSGEAQPLELIHLETLLTTQVYTAELQELMMAGHLFFPVAAVPSAGRLGSHLSPTALGQGHILVASPTDWRAYCH